MLGAQVRLARPAAIVIGVLVASSAVAGWLSLDGPRRYVWAVVVIVGGVGFLLARWNDL